MITTILIDIDNTLLDFNRCARLCMEAGFKEWGIEYNDEMFNYFKVVNDELWSKIEKGIITRKELHKVRWQTVFDGLGIDCDGAEFEQMFLKLIYDSHEKVEGAEDLALYLSEKYDVYIASNGMHAQQINRLTRAGLICYAKKIFSSEKIGFQKPAPEFFDACFKELSGVKKDKVIIIGDSLTADIKGGKNYGIKTLWYNYHKESTDGVTEADYIVNNLCEIKDIL